jgi:hypothetical protein
MECIFRVKAPQDSGDEDFGSERGQTKVAVVILAARARILGVRVSLA